MKYFIVISLCCFSLFLFSQRPSSLTIKYFGLTVHPLGDKTAHLQPYKLDVKARFVVNFGVFLGYEQFVYKDLVGIKYIQGVFSDCSGGLAGISHLGIRLRLFHAGGKHSFYLGFGPTFLYRNSWTRFGSDYKSSGYFYEKQLKNNTIQHRLIPYGMEIEWDFAINEKNHLSVGFTPGIPMAMTLAIGLKHWITKEKFEYQKLYVPN